MEGTGHPKKREIQKERTRRKIIAAALGQFAKTGITVTRTEDIARAAGVSHGTVFMHFPTLEALISAAVMEFGECVSMRMHELAEGDACLRDILEAHIKGLAEYEEFYSRLIAERTLLPKSAEYAFIMIQSSASFHISRAAAKEIDEGSVAAYPMHLLFNTWIGLIHYYMQNRDLFAPGGSVLWRYGKELTGHYMNLISTKVIKFSGVSDTIQRV